MEEAHVPNLSDELQHALNSGDGVVQGSSFVLMRTDVVLDWFGYTEEELRRELQSGLDQIESGDVAEWNLKEFLAEMHKQHDAKTG